MATSAACMATMVLPADVALQEAAHGLGAAHVGDDLPEDAFLRGGGMEGEDLLDGFAHGGAGGEGGANALAHAAALEFEAEFEVEELLEDEAAVRGGGGGHQLEHGRAGFGEVDGLEGFEARGKAEASIAGGRVSGRVWLEAFDVGCAGAFDRVPRRWTRRRGASIWR
jgi:hypothetical protein